MFNIHTPTIHAPAISLGPKWQRIWAGKKYLLAANEVRKHATKWAMFFFFWGLLGEG
jgi:hypothetical protein